MMTVNLLKILKYNFISFENLSCVIVKASTSYVSENSNVTYSVGFDSSVDQVKTFLDFGRDWGRGGDVVTLDPESELVSGVLNGDDLTVRSGVGVGTLLDQSVLVFTNSPQETFLGSLDVVTGFITGKSKKQLLITQPQFHKNNYSTTKSINM